VAVLEKAAAPTGGFLFVCGPARDRSIATIH
jgi:hypothetical protein